MATKDEFIAEYYPHLEVLEDMNPTYMSALNQGKIHFVEFLDKLNIEDIDWDSVTAFLVAWQTYCSNVILMSMLTRDYPPEKVESILSTMLSIYVLDRVLDWQATQ